MATTLYRENNERAYCHEECCAGFGQEELHPWRCSIVEQVATQLEERKKRFKKAGRLSVAEHVDGI